MIDLRTASTGVVLCARDAAFKDTSGSTIRTRIAGHIGHPPSQLTETIEHRSDRVRCSSSVARFCDEPSTVQRLEVTLLASAHSRLCSYKSAGSHMLLMAAPCRHLPNVLQFGDPDFADNQLKSRDLERSGAFRRTLCRGERSDPAGRRRSGVPRDGRGLRMSQLVARQDQLAIQSPAD